MPITPTPSSPAAATAAAPILNSEGLTRLSATALAGHIARGEITAAEAVEAHIRRIETINPRLNAVVWEVFPAARASARNADATAREGAPLGALHGVPFTMKDSIDLAGTPSTFGLPARASHRAPSDNPMVARMRAAGAIPLAKTNVSQLLMYFESDNPLFGRTVNPWNPDRTCGGSSGGEAALIAAGASPIGLGTDIGGSLRVPAAFCGIASLKPTSGRMPDPGRFSMPVGQTAIASQVGVMARHVEDVALGLGILNDGGGGPETENPDGRPPMPLGDFRSVDISRLRVAFYTDDGTFAAAPAARRAVLEAVESLRRRGAEVAAWTPPDTFLGLELLGAIFFADRGELMRDMLGKGRKSPQMASFLAVAGMPRPLVRLLAAALRGMGQKGLADGLRIFGHRDTAHYWKLVEAQADYRRLFKQALDRDAGGPFDLILCPPSALPAFTHGASKDLVTAGSYAPLYNLLGYPAGVAPVTRVREVEEVGRKPSRDRLEALARKVEQGSAGLPMGVQVVARPWREHVALAAMAAIEEDARARPDFPVCPLN